MKRIIIVNEGPTEQEFCNDVLLPYFIERNIYLETPTIKATQGGIVSWGALKKQLRMHLRQDKSAFVTTLFDYYGIKDSYFYPRWQEAKELTNKNERLNMLESAMRDDMEEELRDRFIPYIQLHEFEALLFSNVEVFRKNFESHEINREALSLIMNKYASPEDINDGWDTAPSKRLIKWVQGYSKVVYGACLATEIGIDKLKGKCPRFAEWIRKLEE